MRLCPPPQDTGQESGGDNDSNGEGLHVGDEQREGEGGARMNSHAVLTRLTHGTGKKSATPESLPACLNCDQPYVPKKKDQKFCSDRCRIKNWNFKITINRIIVIGSIGMFF